MPHNEDIGTREDLSLYRIETAKKSLNSAKVLLYKGANNRAYYALFYAILKQGNKLR